MNKEHKEQLKNDVKNQTLHILNTKEQGGTPVGYTFSKYPSNPSAYGKSNIHELESKRHIFQQTLYFWGDQASFVVRKAIMFIANSKDKGDILKKLYKGLGESEFTSEELDFLYSITDMESQIKQLKGAPTKQAFLDGEDIPSRALTKVGLFEIYLYSLKNDDLVIQLVGRQGVNFSKPVAPKDFTLPQYESIINKWRPATFILQGGKRIKYEWGTDFFGKRTTVISILSFQPRDKSNGMYTEIVTTLILNGVPAGGGVSETEADKMFGDVGVVGIDSSNVEVASEEEEYGASLVPSEDDNDLPF